MLQPKDIAWLNGYANKTHIYAIYKRPTSDLGTENEGMEKGIPGRQKSKKAGVAILISDKTDFKIKTATRDKEGHDIMIKGSIQEDTTIVNIDAPNIGAPQYIRQILTAIKGEIDSNTMILGDFNTPLTSMDRSCRQKISEETQALNDTLDQMNLIYIYRTSHPKATEYTFFSSAHGNIDHMLGHKANLSKFKRTEIISSSFSNCNAMRLETNYKKTTVKNTNTWRLNNMLLNNQCLTEQIKEEIKKYQETNENESTTIQNLWDASKAVLRGRFIAIQSNLRKQTKNLK